MQRPRAFTSIVAGTLTGFLGITLFIGGVWLAWLGDTWYYLLAGVGLLVTATLFFAGRREALLTYALVLIGTLLWSLAEVGLDGWALLPRLLLLAILGVWIYSPWVDRNLHSRAPLETPAGTRRVWLSSLVAAIARIEGQITKSHPEITRIFIEARHFRPTTAAMTSRLGANDTQTINTKANPRS